jgi:hypothetical protein
MVGSLGYIIGKETAKETEGLLVKRYVTAQYQAKFDTHPLSQGNLLPTLTFTEPPMMGEESARLGLYTHVGTMPTIYISPNQCAPDVDEGMFESLMHNIRHVRCYGFAGETLDHELAHHFVHERANKLGLAQFTFASDYQMMNTIRLTGRETVERSNVVARTMVSEGIAEYYAKDHAHVAPYVSQRLPQMFSSSYSFPEYPQGLSLVTPILEKHGPRGIDLMLANPPVVVTLYDLPAWQKKILDMH